jgi:uncharacterized metal-binding protein YceD (DUF177 family)
VTAPEFSRVERADTIGAEPRTVAIKAAADERVALARRFELVAVDSLTGTFTLRRDAAGIVAEGRVRAAVTQACSITGDPLAATIDEPVALRFVEAAESGSDEEIELADGDLDVIPYDGGAIDLGETAAETMVLALDPFPRSPGADAAVREAGILSEGEAGPFGALASLRNKLAGN